MPGYFFTAFDVAKQQPGDAVDLDFYVMDDLLMLKVDLEDDAQSGESFDGGPVPDIKDVEALPAFDPETWVLLGHPDFKAFGGDLGASFCTADTLARYLAAMVRLDPCVPDENREQWGRVKRVFGELADAGLGLYISTDE